MIHGFWNLEFIGLSAREFIGSWNLRRHFEEKKKAATRVGANQWSTRHKCSQCSRLERQTAFDELLVERKCQSARNCPCHGNGVLFFSILLGEWTRVVVFFFFFFFKIKRNAKNKKLPGNIRSQYSRFCWKQSTKFRDFFFEFCSSHLNFAFSFLAVFLTSFLNCRHLMLNPS